MEDLSSTRKIPRSRRANTGYLPSLKVTGGVVEYESRLERDFYLLLNHDPSISQFQHQPETLHWTDANARDHDYTPDVLVVTKQGKRLLIEIKEEEEIETNREAYRDSWHAADQAAKSRGWEFYIVTDKMIRSPRFENVWFCLGASRAKFGKDEQDLEKLLHFINQHEDGIEYKSLCTEIARQLAIRIDKAALLVCYAIYHGFVWVDTFSSVEINASTLIRPATRFTSCFRPLFDDIKQFSVKDVFSNGHFSNGTGSVAKIEERTFPEVPSKYSETVEEHVKIVKEWLAVPSKLRTADWRAQFEIRTGYARRTIETWVQRYETQGVEGLVPRFSNAGRPMSAPDEVQKLMEEFRQKYLKNRFSTIKGIYSKFQEDCEKRNLIAPSYTTFQRFVNKLPASHLTKAKHGSAAWRRQYRPAMDVFKDAIMPLQVVEIDNTPFDVFPVDSEIREVLRTPFIVAGLDVYTRMITGYYITFDHPSRITALEVITMTLLSKESKTDWRNTGNKWPLEGVPVLILVDNGLDFRAEDVKNFCIKYGIILEFAPIKTPEYKAYIEQWFEIVKKEVKNEGVPGFRPPLQQRKDMPEFDPEKQAALSLIELERWLVSWIVDTYHARLQQKDHLPAPLGALNEVINGRTPHPLPASVSLSAEEKQEVQYFALHRENGQLTNKGVIKKYLQYNSEDLQVLLRRKGPFSVDYRFDPRDIREIYVIHPDTGRVIQARPAAGWARTLLETYGDSPISESEWSRILKYTREKNRGRVSPSTIREAELQRRREIVEATQRTAAAKKRTKQERLEAEIKQEHAKTSLKARLEKRGCAESVDHIAPVIATEEEDHYVPKKKRIENGQWEQEVEEKDEYKPKKHTYEIIKKR